MRVLTSLYGIPMHRYIHRLSKIFRQPVDIYGYIYAHSRTTDLRESHIYWHP